MEDIVPELLKKIQSDFQKQFEKDSAIAELVKKLETGKATHIEAYTYAGRIGTILTEAYRKNLSGNALPEGKMWYNIAERVITPTMKKNYEFISKYVSDVQTQLNKAAGIGIEAIKPAQNTDRIAGIINRLASEEDFDKISWILKEPIKTAAKSVVDDSIKANAEFHGKAGMQPKIIRKTSGKCCEWCNKIAGVYYYPDVPKDVYRRHENCDCVVEYDPGNGKIQNVHSKQWRTQEERDKIEKRKIAGLEAEDDATQKYIRENIIPKQNIEDIVERQQIHRVGSQLYEQRKINLQRKGQYGPSYLVISDEEIRELVKKYSGKGKIVYNRNGEWDSKETIVTNDKIVGVVVNNLNGNYAETSVFKIHYAKDGIHIVPDYPSKKR